MKAEQNRAIRVEDLTEVAVGRSRFRQAKQRLVYAKPPAPDISSTWLISPSFSGTLIVIF
jgi:hypothetical protein